MNALMLELVDEANKTIVEHIDDAKIEIVARDCCSMANDERRLLLVVAPIASLTRQSHAQSSPQRVVDRLRWS